MVRDTLNLLLLLRAVQQITRRFKVSGLSPLRTATRNTTVRNKVALINGFYCSLNVSLYVLKLWIALRCSNVLDTNISLRVLINPHETWTKCS